MSSHRSGKVSRKETHHICVFYASHIFVFIYLFIFENMSCQSLSRKHTLLESTQEREDQCTVENVSLQTKAPSVWQIKSYLWKKNKKRCLPFFFSRPLDYLYVFCSFSANQVATFALVTHPNELQVPPEAHMSDIQSRLQFTGTVSFSCSPWGNILLLVTCPYLVLNTSNRL